MGKKLRAEKSIWKIVGDTDAKNWVKFYLSVTSNFVKNGQNQKSIFFLGSPELRNMYLLRFFFWHFQKK